MGGIFGIFCTKDKDVVEDIVRGLKYLKHRGNDCTGIVTLYKDALWVRKDKGSIDEVYSNLKLYELKGSIGLGHTRFSTHGRPHYDNAHPHLDCRNRIAVVGDGVIENYEDLRDELIVNGHYFKSRCDFEVVPHLIEDGVNKGLGLLDSFINAVRKLEGIFSIAVLTSLEKSILAYTLLQPLYIGVSEEAYYVSSTKSALKLFAKKYIELNSGEIAYISKDGIKVINSSTLKEVSKEYEPIDIPSELIEKDGYPHYMLKEIYENPYAILRALMVVQKRYHAFAARLISGANQVYIIANGSSLHAGMVASYYLTELVGISPIVLSAAEFPLYHVENVAPGTLVIAISQSGETGDVIKAIYEAKLRGATILAITNNIDSRLVKLSSLYLPVGAGPELSIPATKTFTSTLTVLYTTALRTSEYIGELTSSEVKERIEKIKDAALKLKDHVQLMDKNADTITTKIANKVKSGYVISRGINYPIALEGALKLKEAAYFHAEGVEAGEFRHGPITLVDSGFLTIFIVPAESGAIKATYPLIKDAYDRNASVIVIASEEAQTLIDMPVDMITVPSADRHLTPVVNAIPLQLLSYRLGVKLGCPIDKPKKLVKAVTTVME